MTTGKAIKTFCKECVNSNQSKARKECGGEFVLATQKPCALFNYRLKGGTVKAIRRNCVDCMGGGVLSWLMNVRQKVAPYTSSDLGKTPSVLGVGFHRINLNVRGC